MSWLPLIRTDTNTPIPISANGCNTIRPARLMLVARPVPRSSSSVPMNLPHPHNSLRSNSPQSVLLALPLMPDSIRFRLTH